METLHQDNHDDIDDMASSSAQAAEFAELRAEIARLRAERNETQDADRHRRSTTVDSAIGGTVFKAAGIAALPAFVAFDGDQGVNPNYDRKEKARANDPAKFGGDRATFDTWIR